jgi:hypothetical protein
MSAARYYVETADGRTFDFVGFTHEEGKVRILALARQIATDDTPATAWITWGNWNAISWHFPAMQIRWADERA